MKQAVIFFSFFLNVLNFCFGQKEYEFDYFLNYDYTTYRDSIQIRDLPFYNEDTTIKYYFLTNSKDNSYFAFLRNKDSLHYRLVLIDEKGNFADVDYLKSDFSKATVLRVKCENVAKYGKPYKFQVKNYVFLKLQDTLINKKLFYHYQVKPTNKRKVRKYLLGSSYFLIDPKTDFHLPNFLRSTNYEIWKKEGNLSNGLFYQRYYIDYYDRLHSMEQLISYKQVSMKLIIDEECDYSIKEE